MAKVKKKKVSAKKAAPKKKVKKIIKKPAKKLKKLLPKKKPKKKKVVKKKVAKKAASAKATASRRKPIKKVAVRREPVAAPFSAESFFKAKIKVIGIGGGGTSIVSDIGRSLNKATFVVADTDARAFKRRPGIKYFLFGQELTHGLGTGLNTDLAKQAAETEKEKITNLFKDQDIVIFIASLGGGLGSGATQVFAEAAKDFGGITLGIFTLPFKFEGKHKQKIAVKALRELRRSLNVSITIPNERIFKMIEADTAITDAFSMVNKSLIESLESLIDLIYSPGIINIDFADLRVILKGKGNLAFLNTAEASGNDRADKIIHDILHNPLYQNNNFKVEKVLFNIAGGGNLNMLEVDRISRAISEKSQDAKIIFGISKDLQLKNKIKTTLLMTGAPLVADTPPVEEKPVEKVTEKVAEKEPAKKEKKKVQPKTKKPAAAKKEEKKQVEEKEPGISIPVFNPAPFEREESALGFRKIQIEEPQKPAPMTSQLRESRKNIRRSALDIKKAQEVEEQKKTQQEKEWEIPAFLRFKNK